MHSSTKACKKDGAHNSRNDSEKQMKMVLWGFGGCVVFLSLHRNKIIVLYKVKNIGIIDIKIASSKT